MPRRRDKQAERSLARARIRHLLELARRRLREGETALALRTTALARRIAMRYQTGLRRDEREQVCRACGALRVPGRTARIRLRGGKKSITCLACGTTERQGYRAEQKARRKAREAARVQREEEPPAIVNAGGGQG